MGMQTMAQWLLSLDKIHWSQIPNRRKLQRFRHEVQNQQSIQSDNSQALSKHFELASDFLNAETGLKRTDMPDFVLALGTQCNTSEHIRSVLEKEAKKHN